MNNRPRTLEFDYRPRVDEQTDEKVRYIAARLGIAPNVLIRKWILDGVRRDESLREQFKGEDVLFSLRGRQA